MSEETIYPKMVIRSQAETINLLEQELDQYKNKVEYYENFEINKTVDKIRLRHNKEIKELYQKIDQYKNNWEELKKYVKENFKDTFAVSNGIVYEEILNKMKELEEDK